MKEENSCDKGQVEIERHLLEVAKSEVKFLTTTFFCDTITDASGHVWQRVDDNSAYYIQQLPSAQPERKTGRWIRLTGMMPPEHTGRHYCSECDEFAPVNWKTRKEELTDYCPHCGTKMEG